MFHNRMTFSLQEGLFYPNVDSSDAQIAPHVRKDQVKEEIRYHDGRVRLTFVHFKLLKDS